MRIDKPIRRSGRLSLTSLIDVIFLLLLFFMLSSTFTKFAEVEIVGGRSGYNVASKRPDILINLTTEGWRVNGSQILEDQATETLNQYIETGAKAAVILVDENVTSQILVTAVETVRKTGLKTSVGR